MNKVRFRFGLPEKIGGWKKYSNSYFLGICRSLHSWIGLQGETFLGVGTNLKYYVNEGGAYNDITPIRLVTPVNTVTFIANTNTLSENLLITDRSLTLTDGTNFPSTGVIKINNEIISYSSIVGNTLNGLERGLKNTIIANHATGDNVRCSTLRVSHQSHGANLNDFVSFSDAQSLGGVITENILNQEYEITYIENDSEYLIEARALESVSEISTSDGYSPTYIFATTSDISDGGMNTIAEYQINSGLNISITGNGWGVGGWSRSTWSSGAEVPIISKNLRVWTQDNFGEDLLLNVRDGGIYYWDKSSGFSNRAVELASLTGANTTPTIAKKILVSDKDRHILAFGCDSEINIGVQDPLLIRFSSQESLTDWKTQQNNTAGELVLGSGSAIVTAIETSREILVFTEKSLHTMQYIGPPYTFSNNLISENITIIGPSAAVAVEDKVFWMGAEEFYVYSGTVNRLSCTVRDYIFSDINTDALFKITAGINNSFAEVWWLYPSATSAENDRYVIYNYQQSIWYYGTLNRTSWIDRGIEEYPVAAGIDHSLYFHEFGLDDGSTAPAAGISSYIESSQLSLDNGDNFLFLKRIIPDVTFRNSTNSTPEVKMTLKSRNFPGGNYLQTSSRNVEKTTSFPVEQFDDQFYTRIRGRSFAFKIESSEVGVAWRLGTPRVDVRPDGRR